MNIDYLQNFLSNNEFVVFILTTFIGLVSCLFVLAFIWELVVEKTNNRISDRYLQTLAFWLFYIWLAYAGVGGILFKIYPTHNEDDFLIMVAVLLFIDIMVARAFALFVVETAKDALKMCHKIGDAFAKK